MDTAQLSEDGDDFVNISVIPLDSTQGRDNVSLIASESDSVTQLTVPAHVTASQGTYQHIQHGLLIHFNHCHDYI